MDAAAKAFFEKLLNTPSPSGFEQPVQKVVRERMGPFADEVRTDSHGNVIVVKNPDSPLRLMFAGHCDQIGLLISYIDEFGFLYAQTIGGWDPLQLIGQRMVVWTSSGPIPAVIARKPIHLQDENERKQMPRIQDLWLDIGAKNREEAGDRVSIGDPVTLELGMREFTNDLATAPKMDNTCGLWVVMEAFRRAVSKSVSIGLYAVSTVQEEIGLRGARTSAFGIDPQVGIAVDVTHATDCPNLDRRQLGQIEVGAGPVVFRGPNINPVVHDRLTQICERQPTPYQSAALGRGASNDSNALQLTRAGVATGLVSIPNRYMHSAVETISLLDIDRAADLLANFALELREGDEFTP
ncbi:MAG: M42 family metallopeptidase [Planctomycetales bacterium]|nr:M42 family metallopeptidase [Planctomycetales bacterium]